MIHLKICLSGESYFTDELSTRTKAGRAAPEEARKHKAKAKGLYLDSQKAKAGKGSGS